MKNYKCWKAFLALLTLIILSVNFAFSQYSWNKISNPFSRTGAVCFTIGKYAYVTLGSDSTGYKTDLWCYNAEGKNWFKKANFPGDGREGAVAFVLGDFAYVGTGSTWINYKTKYFKDFWEYNSATDTWTEISNFPGTARSRAIAFSIGYKAYLATGIDSLSEKKDFWEYDAIAGTWKQKADFASSKRQNATAFVINGKGYIAGGVDYSNGTFLTNNVYEYDPVKDSWKEKTFAASFLGIVGGKAFVVDDKAYYCTGSVNEYNPITNTWTEITGFDSDEISSRSDLVAFSINNEGYAGFGDYYSFGKGTVILSDFWSMGKPVNPVPPNNLRIRFNSNNIQKIHWYDNSNNEEKFIIERSDSISNKFCVIDSVPKNTTNYICTGLKPGVDYYYRIGAKNSGGISYSSEINDKTTNDPTPFAPTILAINNITTSTLSLNWNQISTSYIIIIIEASKGNTNSFVKIDSISGNSATGTICRNLQDSSIYYFRIKVLTSGGYSAYSNIISATTLAKHIPLAPTSLTLQATSPTQVKVSWTDNSNNETGFEIESTESINIPFKKVDSNSANDNYEYITNLKEFTGYYFRVRAKNNDGYSDYSSEEYISTPFFSAPNAPSNLKCTVVSSSVLKINWTDNATDDTYNFIERSENGNTNFVLIDSVDSYTREYYAAKLNAQTTYYFRVRTRNTKKYSSYSNEISANTLSRIAIAAPTNLTSSNVSIHSVGLQWSDKSNNEAQFLIEASKEDFEHFVLKEAINYNISSRTINSLDDSTTYYIRVRGKDSSIYSDYSNYITITTLAGRPSNLNVSLNTENYPVIMFTDNSTIETDLILERSEGNSSNFIEIKRFKSTIGDIGYIDNTAKVGKSYYYRVAVVIHGTKLYTSSNCLKVKDYGYNVNPSTLSIGYYEKAYLYNFSNQHYLYRTTNEFYKFDSTQNKWNLVTTLTGNTHSEAVPLVIGNKLYCMLGYLQNTALTENIEYNVSSKISTKKNNFPFSGRINFMTFSLNNKGYIVGGTEISTGTSNIKYGKNLSEVIEYDPINDTYTKLDSFPLGAVNNKLIVTNGDKAYMFYSPTQVYQFDAVSKKWLFYKNLNNSIVSNSGCYRNGLLYFVSSDKCLTEYNLEKDSIERKINMGSISYEKSALSANYNSIFALFYSNGYSYLYYPDYVTAPSKVLAEITKQGKIKISWKDNSSNESNFIIERNIDEKIDTLPANTTEYIDSTFTKNNYYYYAVTAVKKSEYRKSNNYRFYSGIPTYNSFYNATTSQNSSLVKLNFNLNEHENTIERKELGTSSYKTLKTMLRSEYAFTDSTAQMGKTYQYRIRASNYFGTTQDSVIAIPGAICHFNGISKTDSSIYFDASGYDVINVGNTVVHTIYPATAGNKLMIQFEEFDLVNNDTLLIYNGATVNSPLIRKYYRNQYPSVIISDNVDGCLTLKYKVSSNYSGQIGWKAIIKSYKILPPSNLVQIQEFEKKICLKWQINAASSIRTIIERSEGDSNHFAILDSVSVGTNIYNDITAKPSIFYYYRLKTLSNAGYSSYSNTLKAVTNLETPTDLVSSLITSNSVTLKWKDNCSSETNYIVEISTGNKNNFLPIDTVDANTQTYDVKNLKDYSLYFFRVRAMGNGTTSPYSDNFACITAMYVPTRLLIYPNKTNITLGWTTPSKPSNLNFSIERSLADSLHFEPLTVKDYNTNSYTDQSIDTSKIYYYRIRSYYAGVYSVSSPMVTFISTSYKPIGVQIYSFDNGSLNWFTKSTNDESYNVESSTDSINFIAEGSTTSTSKTLSNLIDSATYYFRVQAKNRTGLSPYSDIFRVITPSGRIANLIAYPKTANATEINWTYSSSNKVYVYVERSVNDKNHFEIIDSVLANPKMGSSYVDMNTLDSTNYYYRVKATINGKLQLTNIASVYTLRTGNCNLINSFGTIMYAAGFYYNKHIYFGLGYQPSFYRFDLDSNIRATLPTPFTSNNSTQLATFQIRNKGYYYYNNPAKCLWIYDFDKEKWTTKVCPANMPTNSMSSFVIGDTAYLSDYEKIWKYDSSRDTLIELTGKPYGKLIVTYTKNNKGYGIIANKLWEFNPVTNKWTLVKELKSLNISNGCVVNDKLYYIVSDNSNLFIKEYNFEKDTSVTRKIIEGNFGYNSLSYIPVNNMFYFLSNSYLYSYYPLGPNSPSNLTYKIISKTSFQMNWKDNSDDEDGFIVYKKGIAIDTLARNTTSYTDNKILSGDYNEYSVRCYNSNGISEKVSFYVSISSPSVNINSLSTQYLTNMVSVTWSNTSSADYFIVEYALLNTNKYYRIDSVSSDIKGLTFGLPEMGKTYQIRVRAFNVFGNGDAFKLVIPGSLTIAEKGPLKITYTYYFDMNGYDFNLGFNNYFTQTLYPADSSKKLYVNMLNINLDLGSTLKIYDGPSNKSNLLQTIGGNSIVKSILKASNIEGALTFEFNSGNSNNYSSTGWMAIISQAYVYPPTNLIINSTAKGIKLNWTDNAENEEYFLIERSNNNLDYTVIDSVLADSVTYLDKKITANGNYWYRIRSKSGNLYSDYSNVVTVSLTGIINLKETIFGIYPNPSNGVIHLKLESPNDLISKIVVTSATGQIVSNCLLSKYKNNDIEIDISNKPDGIYFISICSDRTIVTKQIVKITK